MGGGVIGRGMIWWRVGEQDEDEDEAGAGVDQPKDYAAPGHQPPGRAGAEQQAHDQAEVWPATWTR
jgi:hypothetical protein